MLTGRPGAALPSALPGTLPGVLPGPLPAALPEALAGLLAAHLGCAPADVRADVRLADDLGVDSLGVLELVMAMEDCYDVALTDDVVVGVATVGDLATALTVALAGRPGERAG